MGHEQNGNSPQHGAEGRRREVLKILADVLRVAVKFAASRSENVLQTPARHHGIIARDDETRQHAHTSDEAPRARLAHLAIRTPGVGSAMTSDDKLIHHARYAQQQHAAYINQNEGGAAVLSGHIRESPHIAEAHCRARRGEHHS